MSNQTLLFVAAALLMLLVATYANHFDNAFAFDDEHTIVNNVYIRDLGNIPRFFSDATTFSSNPSNQMYRPLMPTLFAIDYHLAGNNLDPFWFHLDSFAWYLLQLVLMFFFFQHVFDRAQAHRWNSITALIATAFYGFHTANAETINYISARSDSLSTFWLIAAFIVYIKLPKSHWHGIGLYMVPLAIGALVKPTVLVFPALLFFYALFFEGKDKVDDLGFARLSQVAMKVALPALIFCGLLYWIQDLKTPDTFSPGGASLFQYMTTQPFVVLHYFANFLLPLWLVADTDWIPLQSVLDTRFLVGVLFITAMLGIAGFTCRKKERRPIAFGILWFFIALLPSSSLIPLAEVMNDHRTFFPYIGLVIALVWSGALYLSKEDARQPLQPVAQRMALLICVGVIGLHAVGTHARNRVWHDDASLWKDVVAKSPNSGRAWMNYGLAQMARHDMAGAEKSYARALELWPGYSYTHINMGILKAAQGKPQEADQYFRNAIQLNPNNAEAYYFYARYLADVARIDEAVSNLEKNLQLSPAHIHTRYLLMAQYQRKRNRRKLQILADETLKLIPGDGTAQHYLVAQTGNPLIEAMNRATANPTEGNYLNLSLEYYKAGKFDLSRKAAEKALRINPHSASALNNICSAYNNLDRYAEAIKACEKAIAIKPDFQLAINNLNHAKSMISK